MTKAELKKEAEKKAGIYFDSLEVDNGNVSDTKFSGYDVFVAYEKGALDFADPREKRIAELEAQIEELKKKLKEKLKTIADKDLSFVAKFDALEIENAELKEKVNILDNCDKLGDMITEAYKDQITKAKEIIKTLLSSKTDFDERRFALWAWKEEVNKAEQFLKESE